LRAVRIFKSDVEGRKVRYAGGGQAAGEDLADLAKADQGDALKLHEISSWSRGTAAFKWISCFGNSLNSQFR
jgi:hypothetical protein